MSSGSHSISGRDTNLIQLETLTQTINKSGQSRAMAHLAVVDGFEKNESGARALRVGIDTSIWLQHVTCSAGPPKRGAPRVVAEVAVVLTRLQSPAPP